MRRWGTGALVALLTGGALILLLIGATLGVMVAPSLAPAKSSAATPGSVDIGFSQDMIVHHTQGISMANLALLHTTNSDVRARATDIATTQQTDVGEMSGWLDLWGQPRIDSGTLMSWMSSGGTSGHAGMDMGGTAIASNAAAAAAAAADGAVMPGMATNTEIAKLRSLTGQASDIYFLQLMIRHHQGGAEMMQYAAAHATLPVVRNFAGKMLAAQQSEISIMTQMLTKRGAAPLPFDATMPTG